MHREHLWDIGIDEELDNQFQMDGSKGPIHLLQILWVIRGAVSDPLLLYGS